jgi:tRNA threonylcarbamoyladenosine biosynthesis protein TsaE
LRATPAVVQIASMQVPLIVPLPDLAATEALAARLACVARAGDCILMEGPLGAGKTAFARAFLRAAADDQAMEVPSPSFTLVQIYDTKIGPVFHYDLWRLDGPNSLTELDWEDALDGVVLVEWPDRLGSLRPRDALTITLRLGEGEAREAALTGWDGRIESLVPSSPPSPVCPPSPSWPAMSRPSAHERLGADGRDAPGHDAGNETLLPRPPRSDAYGQTPGHDEKTQSGHDDKMPPRQNATTRHEP